MKTILFFNHIQTWGGGGACLNLGLSGEAGGDKGLKGGVPGGLTQKLDSEHVQVKIKTSILVKTTINA